MIYEVSSMGKKFLTAHSLFDHLPLTDTIFMVVTLFLKSLKLVRDLKLQGEKNTCIHTHMHIHSSKKYPLARRARQK